MGVCVTRDMERFKMTYKERYLVIFRVIERAAYDRLMRRLMNRL